MKKKNKVIIGALSTIGIGSMVIAPALAFANNQSPNNKDVTSKLGTKKQKMSSLATTPVTTINSHTFNDNAYLQTLNQAGITNPVGKAWTVQSSLSYFKTHLQNDINVFNCDTIFRWVVIQNFNYNLNELVGTLSANSNFKVDVPNFNYTLSNIKNNGNIANFSCTLNVTIDFVITSKNDGATLSFTNNYTYNNLKYTPTITTNGYNGYGAFALTNNANGTLTVNNATYFGGMQLSGNWTNSDFSNLLKANWLPTINPSTSITTSNYTYALADMVQRASHSISLNNNQSQFMSILPTTMIDTFNLGYKFANAASIEIVMNTKGITPNANNDYTIFPGTTVTLQASQTLSSINLKNPDLAYQWEELSNGIWTNVGSETTRIYSFPVANTTSQYRLYVYNTKNSSFNLTSNTITINPTVQSLTIDSVANTSTYKVGENCTLQIDQAKSNYGGYSITGRQWYVNSTDTSTGGTAISGSNAQKPSYNFAVTGSNYYYLVLTFSNGSTLTSNPYFVTDSLSSVTVENLTPASDMTDGVVNVGSTVTLGISKKQLDQLVNNGQGLTYTWYQYNPNATSASDQWKKVGTSPTNDPGQFSFQLNSNGKYKVEVTSSNVDLTSSPISLTTNNATLTPEINGSSLTPINGNSNSYQGEYGSKVTIKVNNASNWPISDGYHYQWQYWNPTGGPDKTGAWENATGTNATNPQYSYNLNGSNPTTYRLEIYKGDITSTSTPIITSTPIDVSPKAFQASSKITVKDTTTGQTISDNEPVQQGDKIEISTTGTGVTGISPDSPGKLQYQWQTVGSNGIPKDINGANSPTYSLRANKNGTYRLKITDSNDPNNPVYTPWQSINVTNNYPLVIQATDSTTTSAMSMVADTFEYNSSVTLSMNINSGNWDNQPKLSDLTYSWYEVGNSNPLRTSSKENTYRFTLTQNGNEYYLVITGADGFSLTSNTITINYQSQSIKIDATQDGSTLNSTNDIPYGTSVSLNFVNNSNNFVMGKSFTYQWEVLKDGTWTADGSATTSPTGFPVNVINTQSYRLVVMNGTTQVATSNVISLSAKSEPLYITNTATSSSSGTTSSSSSSTSSDNSNSSMNSTMNVNYGDSNITLGLSGYWATQKLVNKQDFNYSWQTQQPGSSTWTTVSHDPTYKVPTVTTSGVSYRLVVEGNSKISGFNLTSAPLTINLNKYTIEIQASKPTTGSTYSFDESVKLSIDTTGTTNINLNSNYTYTWQYTDNSSSGWTNFQPGTSTSGLTFNIIQPTNFRLHITNSDGFSAYSNNQLTLGCTAPTQTISATDASSSTPATSFNPLTNITLTASSLSVPSGVTLGYSWTNLSNSSDKLTSATSTQTYFLINPLTAQVIYELSDANNAYYDYSFNSSPISIKVNKQALVIGSSNTDKASSTTNSSSSKDATSVAETPSNTYNIGSTVKLTIDSDNYWQKYSQDNLPTGYKLKFQWFDNQTGDAISSATNPSYSFTLNKTTAHGYYLEISCVNANRDVVYSIKSNTINVSMFIPSLTIIASNNSSTSSTSTSTTQNSFTTYYGQPVTLSIPSNSTWLTSPISGQTYQWQIWDATSNSWSNLTKTASTAYTPYTDDATTTGIYRLQIVADSSTINSNSLTVIVSGLSNKVSIGIKDDTNNATSFNYGTKVTLQTTSISSSLDLTGAKYAWKEEASGTTSFTTITGASGSITDNTVPPYTYTVTGSAIFELVITLSNGVAFTSNQVGINVNSTMFAIDSVSGDNSFALGSSATLQINKSASNYNPSTTYTYQWYSNTTSATTGGTLISSSTTKSTYTIKSVTSASYYYLVVKDGTTTYTSTNSWYITPTSQKISIIYTTSSPTDIVKTNTVYYGSNVSLQLKTTSSNAIKNETDLAYTWYEVNPQDPAISSGTKVASGATYSFDAIATGTYVLAITGTNVDLISNPLTIAVYSTLALNSSAVSTTTSSTASSSNSKSTNTIALLDLSTSTYGYGASVTLSPSSAWNSYLTASVNKANFTYQWYQLENGSWSKITSAISMDYNFDIYQSGTYELKVTYKNGDVTGTFTGSINVPVTMPTATITATPTSTGIKGWVTSSYDANSTITNISSKTGSTDYATINWGQSVTFNATLSDANLNSGWTATWQYLDPTSDSWQPINTSAENVSLTGTAISSITYTCDQTGTYRIELVNNADASIKIYSGIISVNVNTPKVAIGVNTSATSNTINEFGKGSYQPESQTLSSTGTSSSNSNSNSVSSTATNSNSTAPIVLAGIYGDSYTISIDSGNYWLSSVSGLSNVTYSWYEVGNSSPLLTGSSDTSYTISSLTSSGSYYCTVQADGKTFTSNTVTINMQAIDVTISTTATNPVTFGTKVELTSKLSNINSTLPSDVTYQWQYLNGTSWENVPATSNFDASSGNASTYKFTITHSNTYRLILQANGKTIATSSTAINLICNTDPFSLSATASNDQSGTNFVNGSKVTITPAASSTIYQDYIKALGTKIHYAWYSQTGAIQSSSTIYTGESSDSLSFDLTSTTAGTYYLVISDSTIGFKVQSYPITINPTTSSINLSAKAGSNTWSTDGTQWSSTDAVSFASRVTLTATGSTGMNLSSGYSFTWYFIDSSGQWTEYGTTTAPTLTINNAVRNSNFKVVATNNTSKDSWTSATIYVGITNPTVSITASANSKTGTSFNYASWLTLDSTVDPTITSTDGSWTYAWTEVGQTEPFSTLQDTNWLLTANSTFEVTYSYTAPSADTSSYYQGISFTSQPTYIKVMMSSSSSSSSSGTSSSGTTSGQTGTSNGQNNIINPVITAGESSVYLGQSTTLSLKNDSYWATYSFPSKTSGYSFTYTWMSASTNAAISTSATGTFDSANEGDLSYKLPALSATGSYYLVITCENSSKDTVFSVRSNVMQINVTSPTITIGYAQSSTVFDTTSTSVNQGNKVTIEVQPSQTTPYWYSMCKYQWVSYDAKTQSWNTPNDSDWTTGSASSTISEEVGVGSYKLAVQIDGVTVYSNSFTVSENKAGRSITITQPGSVAYGQDVTLSATNMGFTSAGDWTFSWEVLNNSTGKYEPISHVFTTGTYTVNDSTSADSLTINNVISSYTFEVVATSTNTKLASVTSNQVTVNYTDITLNISSSTTSYKCNATKASAISIDSSKTTWKTPYDVKTSDLVYQWYENGTAIKGANTDSYTPRTTLIGTTSYYLKITLNVPGLSAYQVKSNTITITVDQPAITIKSNQASTSIDFGTNVTLSSTLTNIVSLPSGVTYQWRYLDNGTWKRCPASTNIDGTGATSDQYSFTITSDNTYQLVLVDGSSIIATSNVLTLSCADTPLTLTASANGKSGISFANGSDVTITPMSDNIYQKTLPSRDIAHAWYNSKGEIVSSDTSYTGYNASYLKFTLNATTAGSYYLKITDSTIGFSITSTPITININNSSVSLQAQVGTTSTKWTSSTWNASKDTVAFATSVTLSAEGNGIDLSNGYTFAWQFLDNGVWTTYPGVTNGTLTINAVRSTSFQVIVTNSTSGAQWTSNTIYVGITTTKPTISVTSGSSTTAATSFKYASYLNLDSSMPTLASGDGTWASYTWTELGQAKPFSDNQDTNWLLTANTTFEVTYTYAPTSTNSTNPYYENITFTSDPANITLMMNSTSSSSSSNSTTGTSTNSNVQSAVIDPAIMASANSVELGQSSKLSLNSDNYWATYTFPSTGSGYTFTYAWMDTANNTTLTSGTFDSSNEKDLSYQLSALTSTGSYYLVITCMDGKNTVFSVRSNVVQVVVTTPTITIGTMKGTTFDTSSTSVPEGNTVSLTLLSSDEKDAWYTSGNYKYQWLTYDTSTSSWPSPSTTGWQTPGKDGIPANPVDAGSYILAIQIAGVIVKSNIFTVYYQSSTANQIMIGTTTSAPFYVGSSVSVELTSSLTKYNLNSSDTWTWIVNGTKETGTGAAVNNYTISDLAKDTTYTVKLIITGPHGVDLTSNTITITVVIPTIQITTKSGDNSFVYGNSATLEVNKTLSQYDASLNWTYQWYVNTTNSTSISTATKLGTTTSYKPYKIDSVTSTGYYFLVMTDGNNSYTSNTWYITPTSKNISITYKLGTNGYQASTNTKNIEVYWGSAFSLSLSSNDSWAANQDGWTYSWYNVNPADPNISGLSPVYIGESYSTTGFTSGSYELVITNNSDKTFQLISNIITVNVLDTFALTATASTSNTDGANIVQSNNPQQYEFDYGQQIDFAPQDSSWLTYLSKLSNLTCTWYQVGSSTALKTTTSASYDGMYVWGDGTYYLSIKNATGQSITTAPITIINNHSLTISFSSSSQITSIQPHGYTLSATETGLAGLTNTAKAGTSTSAWNWEWQVYDPSTQTWNTLPAGSWKDQSTNDLVQNYWNYYHFTPTSNYPVVRLALTNTNNPNNPKNEPAITSNSLTLNVDLTPLQITVGNQDVSKSYNVNYNSNVTLNLTSSATSAWGKSSSINSYVTYQWYNAKTNESIASQITDSYQINNDLASGEYYLEITPSSQFSSLFPSDWSVKSNVIDVNVSSLTTTSLMISAKSTTNYYGATAQVDYDSATNLTWNTNLQYEWAWSTDNGSTWTAESKTAWNNQVNPFSTTLLTNTWVKLMVYNGSSLITTSNIVELTPDQPTLTIAPTVSATTSGNGVYTFNYGTSTSLEWTGWWSKSTNYDFGTNATYTWKKSTDGGSTWTSLDWTNSATPSTDTIDVTSAALYKLVITISSVKEGSSSFSLTSSPITINTNNQASVTIAASASKITTNGATYIVPTFGEATTLTPTLSNVNTNYKFTYTYQFLANGKWTNWTGTVDTKGSTSFDAVRSCEWRLMLTDSTNSSFKLYSNNIYVVTTMPALTLTAKDGTTSGTSFAIGSIIDVTANSITVPSDLTGSGTTTITNIGNSNASVTNYVIGGNTAFKATYTYTDSSNAYYNFTIKSSILNITATSTTLVIDATSGDSTVKVSNTYSFDFGSAVNVAINTTSWLSYKAPTGYKLSYQWYYDGSAVGTASSTYVAYDISSLTSKNAGEYYLTITCTKGKNQIFSIKSNTITINPSHVTFNVGYDNSSTYTDTTYTTNYGASGISLNIDNSTVTGIAASMLTSKDATYQWQYWAGANGWQSITSTNAAGTDALSATTDTLSLTNPLLSSNTYRLQVSLDGSTFTSASFNLVIEPTSQNLTIEVANQVAPYTDLSYDSSYTLEPTSSWWQNITKNNSSLTCQWYANYGNGKWTALSGTTINSATGATTPMLSIKLMQDASYKLEITSKDSSFGTKGVLTSNIISLSINANDKGSFTIEATYDLSENGFTYDNTGSDVSINVPYDMSFPNITLSSSNSHYWQNQCNNPNGTYTYQLQAYQEAIPGDSSVSAGWVNFADYYKNLGVSTDWTTSDGKFTGFTLTGAPYSLKMSAMWRLAITNNYTGKVTYSNSIVINVANPDIIAQSSVPDVPTYTYQSINKQAAGNPFTVAVPHGQFKRVYLNPVWNTYVNVHYSSSWTTSTYLEQYEPSTSKWITPTGSAITWTFGSEKVQQKNSNGTETTVTVYYVEFNNNTNYQGSTFDYRICLNPYSSDKPAILSGEADAKAVPVTPISQLFTVIYGAIQSLSISAIANGTSSATTEVNGQLGQGFSVSLSPQSIQDVKTIIAESEAKGQKDVHGYWVKVVNGQESVIQTAPNYKQIFCNAFLNSTEFETIMKSYIALAGYGNYLGNTATYDDFKNWNVSFQELPAGANESGYGNNVFGILNDLVITATNKSQITVDNWSDSKNNWVAGTSVPANSLFTWTLPYTWIDSNNESGITQTVIGTNSRSTSMTLDYLTYQTAKAISGMTQSEFDNAFNTNANGGQEIFGFSVTDLSSNQSLVDFCPFNFTSSSGHSYSSFVKNITVAVDTSFVDNYTNVPLTAIDNETIKYIVVPSSYWTTKKSSNGETEMVPSSNYPSTAMAPVESNLIYVTIPTLNKSTFSFSNFSALQSNWESENSSNTDTASDIAQQPFVQLSKNYYQVPFDQAITLSSNVTSCIANLNQIAPGYSFYIGYFFNGDLANWEQLLNTGSGYWGYNFQQVYNATSFDISNFPINNDESIQFALFYTPDNTSFMLSPNNPSQVQPKDLNVIWESSTLIFTIAQNMYATITPPSGTSAADATKAGFDRLNQTVYVLPATGYDDYVVSLDPKSSIYKLSEAENNKPFPSMSTSWINLQTYSECTTPSAVTGTYNFNNEPITIYNSYGIIGEFLEIATFGNPHWSIYATWFPNLYSMFESWMPDGATAWPWAYNPWLNSDSYKYKGNNPKVIEVIPFMPSPLVYPIQVQGGTVTNIGQAIVDGTPINLNGEPFSGSWNWYYKGNYSISSNEITKNAGIGSDFNIPQKTVSYTVNGKSVTETYLTSNISFNYNTNINDFISGNNTLLAQSQYSYSAYAPLKFNIGSILGTEPLDEPIITRLVVFTLNTQTLNNTYYTSSDTFEDVGLKVFKYVTPPLVILPAATAAKLTGASAVANEFAIPNSLK